MAKLEDKHSSAFYWDTIVFEVEDELFRVPLCEFVKSSEVFADMFLLPSGPAAPKEGQDREHPIVLEGYKKDEFTCLLKVMYPTAGSLISDTKFELCLEKEEWTSVLKLSTIWNMKKIRKYAIHRLSTDVVLSPVEKILLARAYKVAAWLNEGVTSLVSDDPGSKFEDLVTLGWETVARILWIRRDDIKCSCCSSSSSLINDSHSCSNCGHAVPGDAELTIFGLGSASGNASRLVVLGEIRCHRTLECGGNPFNGLNISCNSCSRFYDHYSQVRITPRKELKEMMKEMFGEEIEEYELAMI